MATSDTTATQVHTIDRQVTSEESYPIHKWASIGAGFPGSPAWKSLHDSHILTASAMVACSQTLNKMRTQPLSSFTATLQDEKMASLRNCHPGTLDVENPQSGIAELLFRPSSLVLPKSGATHEVC